MKSLTLYQTTNLPLLKLKNYKIISKIPYRTVLYRTVPCPTLPYPTLPYPTPPYPTAPHRTVPYPTLPHPTLPHLVTLPYPTLPSWGRNCIGGETTRVCGAKRLGLKIGAKRLGGKRLGGETSCYLHNPRYLSNCFFRKYTNEYASY